MRRILFLNDADTVDSLRAKLVEIHASTKKIRDTAKAQNRDLTDVEEKQVDDNLAMFALTEKRIERLEKEAAMNARLDEVSPHASRLRPTAHVTGGTDNHRFKNLGEFAASVRAACMGDHRQRQLVMNAAPASYGSEGTNADGGFIVPPDIRTNIVQLMFGEQSIAARCDVQTTNGYEVVYPKDENSPWSASGITVSWTGEAAQVSPSKAVFGQLTTRLDELTALVPVTDRLLNDASALEGYLRTKTASKFSFKLTDAIVNGNGIGMPLGLMNAPARISVAKESAQTKQTVNYQNIIKMWNRLHRPDGVVGAGVVWLINPDVEPQLHSLTFPNASGTAVAPYLPPGGISGQQYSTLLGKPILALQSCQTLGTEGDIILTDLSQYLLIKNGELQEDVSIHLWFDYNITAYRFKMRVGGNPWWSAAISAKNGSNTYSPIVTLAERA